MVRPSSSNFFAAGQVARLLVGDVRDREEVEHLVDLAGEARSCSRMRPRRNQALQMLSPCLVGRHHHQVLAHRHGRELVGDLEGAQKALVEKLVGGRPVMSSPPMVTRPEVGGRRPAMTLKSVVFPAPLGPISPVMDPGLMASEAPSTALKPPKCLWRSWTSIIPVPFRGGCGPWMRNGPGQYPGPRRAVNAAFQITGIRPY
jgi:hypothetical protein